MWKKALILMPLLLLLAGCATPTITNVSAQRQLRDVNNQYPVEVALDSRQQALRWESIQPQVIVGTESYPMRPVRYMRNRWECLIPVPANVNSVTYHYKFDYQVNAFGGPRNSSSSSRSFTLQILDR